MIDLSVVQPCALARELADGHCLLERGICIVGRLTVAVVIDTVYLRGGCGLSADWQSLSRSITDVDCLP